MAGRRTKTARAKVAADEVYNARKRYQRAAQRNLERAEASAGATAAKYRQLARQNLQDALATYATKGSRDFSKPIKQLSQALGVSLSDRSSFVEQRAEARANLVSRSTMFLEGSYDEQTRREQSARLLLNSPTVGSRIIGGLVDVWRDDATVIDDLGRTSIDQSRILPSLFRYFKVDNLADMIDRLSESIGPALFDLDDDRGSAYQIVKLQIQSKVREGTLVA